MQRQTIQQSKSNLLCDGSRNSFDGPGLCDAVFSVLLTLWVNREYGRVSVGQYEEGLDAKETMDITSLLLLHHCVTTVWRNEDDLSQGWEWGYHQNLRSELAGECGRTDVRVPFTECVRRCYLRYNSTYSLPV